MTIERDRYTIEVFPVGEQFDARHTDSDTVATGLSDTAEQAIRDVVTSLEHLGVSPGSRGANRAHADKPKDSFHTAPDAKRAHARG